MLISADDGREIDSIPYKQEYDVWRKRLPDVEFKAITEKLDSMIDKDEIHTSSWMPGSAWTGTVFQPIYEKACKQNFEQAAMFFGLIVWEVFMHRDDKWSFGRYEKDGVPIQGLVYFRIRE